MIKTLRIAVCVLFCLTAVLFALTFLRARQLSRDTYPVISFDTDRITVGLEPTDAELLSGVTARDAEDGDLTGEVLVESISHFITPGVCNVTYAVRDSENHVTTATRRMEYEGYTPPRFTMSDDLVFSVNEQANPFRCIGAVDVLDGNISDRVKIAATTSGFQSGVAGVYPINVQVTNSKGDVIYLDLSITIENTSLYGPKIQLKNYLLYITVGESVDLRDNIRSVEAVTERTVDTTETMETTEDGEAAQTTDESLILSRVRIETDLDTTTVGVYQADYRYTDEFDREAHAVLTIVVEDKAE